jgi:ubiquinone/menaquinone biosynthesis C-methylase UbiE
MSQEIDSEAFRSFERDRHGALAQSYSDFFAPITAMAIEPLLSSIRPKSGEHLLDVACGSGELTIAASKIGLVVSGVDLAPEMVDIARSNTPDVDFRIADVEALPWNDNEFDCVVSNLGLGHFPDPERALRECVRVICPGGRLAVSWWDLPSRQRVQGLLIDALDKVGDTSTDSIPIGPPLFRYSDDRELQVLLEKSGLQSVKIQNQSTTYRVDSVDTLWEGSMGSLARSSAIVLAQPLEVQERIRSVHRSLASQYADDRGLAIPISFKLAAGVFPG